MVARAEDIATRRNLRRCLGIIGWGVFVTMLGQPSWIGSLPIKFLLKDDLHFQPHSMAVFLTIAGAGWYLKPLMGLLSDSVPLWGSSRKAYLILGSGAAMALWPLVTLGRRSGDALLTILVLLNLAIVMASTVLGGAIVEVGQRYAATGRLSSLRSIVRNCAIMIAGPLTGYLSLRSIGLTAAVGMTLFASLLLYSIFLPEQGGTAQEGGSFRRAQLSVSKLLRSKPLWLAACMVFLVELAPGFSTPLFYYQTDTLKFDGQFVGFLSGVNSLSGVIAGIVYVYGCRRFPLRNLLVASVLFHAAGSLAYLGYHSKITAVWIEAVGGFGAVLAQIPLFDLAARATPRGSEAIGYSLIMSVWNFGTNASDVLGAWLFDAYRLNVTHLVWLNAGSTLLVLGVLPFLPTFLADRPDEGPAPPSHLDENGGRDCPL